MASFFFFLKKGLKISLKKHFEKIAKHRDKKKAVIVKRFVLWAKGLRRVCLILYLP